ncbi:hypothetical protein PG987_007115 [Apiospora arundinis]
MSSTAVSGFASSISEVLEGTEWWISNEGGVMSKDGWITGIRTDGQGHGEYLDGKTVITRLASGNFNKPDTFNRRAAMAKKTSLARRPVGVVVGNKHPGLQTLGVDMKDEKWAILEFFLITDLWIKVEMKEQNGNKEAIKHIMVKLERFDIPSTPTGDGASAFDQPIRLPTAGESCNDCEGLLVLRYKDCPAICGSPECDTTKESSDSNTIPTGDYDEKYVSTPAEVGQIPPNSIALLPKEPQPMSKEQVIDCFSNSTKSTDRINWEGWFCRICLRFNLRIYWNRLECRNCAAHYPYGMPNFRLDELVSPQWRNITTETALPGLVCKSHIVHTVDESHPRFVLHTFRLDDENMVVLGVPKETAIAGPDGFESLFGNLWSGVQDGSIPLRRCPAGSYKDSGQMTRFFATNYGEAYNAKMKTEDTSFAAAPEMIRTIKEILTTTVTEVLSNVPQFNEMLCIGNYPNMAMNWHQDGENGVGPVVASLSFGGEATMEFAMDPKHLVGRGGKGSGWKYDPILPGCIKEDEKQVLAAKRDAGNITQKEYEQQFRDLVGTIKAPSEKRSILKFPLPGTGALMIQVGATLNQRFYHRVEHKGIARLVTTCRSIVPPDDGDERPAKRAKTSDN